jgi:Hypothetical protein (DUF2513)
MRRDLDLIRELMLKLEALPVPAGVVYMFQTREVAVEEHTREEIDAHLDMIYDAGYVIGDGMAQSGDWVFQRLSPEGHDFLDSVRDQTVWSKTKAGASAVGGWTLDIVKELAKAYIKQQLGLSR